MITHIVAWTLKSEDGPGKTADVAAIAGALEPLVGVVDGLHDLTVRANAVDVGGNMEAGLISHFESAEHLRAYIVHPEHVKAVEVVRAHTTGRTAIDFAE
jgi:hypothetical protein